MDIFTHKFYIFIWDTVVYQSINILLWIFLFQILGKLYFSLYKKIRDLELLILWGDKLLIFRIRCNIFRFKITDHLPWYFHEGFLGQFLRIIFEIIKWNELNNVSLCLFINDFRIWEFIIPIKSK